jgi:hypothetical protein
MTDQSSGPAQRASLHPIPGGAVLFDDAEGRLYALNPAAGLTWLCIAQGLSQHESTLVLADTFEIASSMAAEWFRVSMAKFQDLGLFESGEAKTRIPVARNALAGSGMKGSLRSTQREYRLLDQIVCVSAPDEPLAAIESLLGTLRVSTNCNQRALPRIEINVVPRGARWDITLDEDIEATCDTDLIVAEVERVLVQRIVPGTPHLLTFHAAALQRQGRTLLLAGPSGAGKTTLSLALTRAGWCFGSDEIVLLGCSRDMRALPLPPCIKEDSFSLIETWFPELCTAPKHQRYGHTVKYLPITSASTTFSSSHGSVVFLRFDPGGPNEIKAVDQFVALERLLAQCVFVPPGFQHRDVEQLLLWHAEQSYFDMSFRDCETAVAILRSNAAKA